MSLSAEEIRQITAYLDATTPLPEKADLMFIPGTRLPDPILIAADLFKQRIAPYIIVTGGENRYTGEKEADKHYHLLIEQGVPPEHIIVENHASNTLENVTFSLPLIQEKIELVTVKSILVIAKWMHSRRVLMTLKRHLPHHICYYACTYAPEGITQENWHLNPLPPSANVMKNWENIPLYLEQQHIEEVIRDGDGFI